MKNFNNLFKKLLLLLFAIILFASCENNEVTNFKTNEKNLNFISKTNATKFANNLLFNDSQGNIIKKEVKEVKEVLSKTDNQYNLYVMNYKDGGFVILSADNRSFPIFAVSSKNEFKLNDKNYPSGLVDWLETATEYIDKIKEENKLQDNHTKYLWEHPNAHENVLLTIAEPKSNVAYREPPIDPNDPYSCGGYAEVISPLLSTTWDQWYGYNNFTPNLGCSGNGHAPTGCVATAMAQIMKYHNYPNNYNWNLMPNNYGSNETSTLMASIGNMVGMNYGCSGSSADTQGSVADAFKNFGYQQSATFINYDGTSNYNVVRNELRASKPVILRGGRKRSGITWPWNYYTDGHAWVCDGFVYWSDCSVSMLSLYMNWGWSGSYNGVYAFNNFNPSTYTFNYQSGAVVGIRKP